MFIFKLITAAGGTEIIDVTAVIGRHTVGLGFWGN